MRRLHAVVKGLRNLLRGSTLDREMDDELAFHLDCRAQDLIAQGLSADDARRRARLDFGSTEGYKERTRDARRPRVLEDLFRDLGYAGRSLRRSPALVLTCVLSLGLGIGVNTTIFTALRSVLRHQPSIVNPDRVVGMEPGNSNQFSYLNYRDVRDSGIFADTLGYRIVRVNVRIDNRAERLLAVATTGNFFRATGVLPRLGREFALEEAPEQQPRVAVLTDGCWRRLFDGDPGVIGRTVHLNGEPFDIVGVMPAGYRGVMPLGEPDLYLPLSTIVLPHLNRRENANGLTVLGRLRDRDTAQQAQIALTRLGGDLEHLYPEANDGMSAPAAVFPLSEMTLRGAPPEATIIPAVILVLFGLVLLIACGNVAGLLLARATARRHEIAMRVALGARRTRLIQALLAEALVLGALSATGGVLLTLIAIPSINALAIPGNPSMRLVLKPDAWLLGYAALLGAATTIACGLVPALRATRVDVSATLQDTGTLRTTGRMTLRHAFVVGQVALSAFLLVLSAVMMRTATRGTTVDPGFAIGSGVVVAVSVPPSRSPESSLLLAQELTSRLASLPGVQSTSVATMIPLAGDIANRNAEVRGRPIDNRTSVLVNTVGPRYFETMGIAIMRGREFRWTDREGSVPVAIVNQAFVQRYIGDGEALGTFVRTGTDEYAQIVGVVADTQFVSLTEAPRPLVYYSYAQQPSSPLIHVRVSGAPEAALRTLSTASEAIDPGSIVTARTLRQAAGFEILLRRAAAMLMAGLGALGFLLALVGLYGVMAYTVAAQRAEIGVRMALGASPAGVLSLVLRRGLRLVALGLLGGLAASLLVTFPTRAWLVGVSPIDPLALVTTAIVILTGGLCASYFPAQRATRIEPLAALRQT